MKRFPFLDWMRGLAILLMIQSHTFDSFARMDVRGSGTFVLSQFIGGMAAPLFLFMAGMTLGFHMEKPGRRWLAAFRRGAYVLAIAFLFRLTNYIASLAGADWHEIAKVDILNCMGVAMIVFSAAALFEGRTRTQFAVAGGLAIAAAAPLVAHFNWGNTPVLIREYLVPAPGTGRFAFFPFAAYIGFGIAAGTIVKRAPEERFDRLMQWLVLIGFALVFSGQYFASIPFSIYPSSDFWTNSPALVLMRVGISLWLLAGAYLWTEYGAGSGWSWMRCMGRNSLMVYWVHVMLVYGDVTTPLHRGLGLTQSALATLVVVVSMVGLSAAWLAWKQRRAAIRKAAAATTDAKLAAS